MTEKLSLLLLGAGHMGGALLAAWSADKLLDPVHSSVVDPNPSDRILTICRDDGMVVNPVDDGQGYDICVLAVKPQMFPDILPTLNWPGIERTLFISIAAGVTVRTIQDLLKASVREAKVIRTMPNLPAAVREGMTLLTAGDAATAQDMQTATTLFEAAGGVHWTATEDELDRLMGVSGCGPAYVYLLVEALTDAAIAAGATADEAAEMATQTVIGAAKQLTEDGRSADVLRASVTSKGGTTAAALSVLDAPTDGFRPLVGRAVRAAYDRAKELGA